jgi:hypothetical protein
VIHELRTYTIKTEHGGVRELERRFGNGIDLRLKYSPLGGFFHTLTGNMSQVVHIWPYEDLQHRVDQRAAANRDESNRWPPGIAELFERQEVEILIPAPFMPELKPQEAGRLWELRWYDFAPADSLDALDALKAHLPTLAEAAPPLMVWTVDVGPSSGRIYVLTPFRDFDHREAASAVVSIDEAWAGDGSVVPVTRGVKLLEPAHFSTLQ